MSAFRPSLRRLTVLVESQHAQLPATTRTSTSNYASRTLYVKPQDGFLNMAQVFAVARELEKRFGPITDMKTVVEPGYFPRYKSWAWMTFEQPIPRDADGELPQELSRVIVKNPEVEQERPGGVGLDDLQNLLERPDRTRWTKLVRGSHYLQVDVKFSHNGPGSDTGQRKRIDTKEANIAPTLIRALSSFHGFSPMPTPEMAAVIKKWQSIADSRGIRPFSRPPRRLRPRTPHDEQEQEKKLPIKEPVSDALVGYLDQSYGQGPRPEPLARPNSQSHPGT